MMLFLIHSSHDDSKYVYCSSDSFRADNEYTARVIKLALDIANGMKYVAALRILHVDLKAENVLLQKAPEGEDTRGSGVIAKVADFGLAQVRA